MPDNDTPPSAPPSENGPGNLMDQFMQMMGNMQDDRSRRRRSRRQQEEEDELQIDCLVKNRPNTTFQEVAGNKTAKEELQEIAKAVQDGPSYTRFGANLPKGILMTGRPGCGKTYMTGALANTLNAPFYHVQVSNVVSMWFGQSEKNLQKIFDHAKKYCKGELDITPDGKVSRFDPDVYASNRECELFDGLLDQEDQDLVEEEDEANQEARRAETTRRASEVRAQIKAEIKNREDEVGKRYAIVFIDEIDALGAARENTPFQGGVSNRIVSVLLENMDGLESTGRVLVVASTNRVDAMDAALRRAGRFDRIIKIKKPDQEAREKMFEIHFKKAEKKAGREFIRATFAELAMATKGLVGADIAEIVRKACQEQAKKYRDATPEAREALDFIDTDAVLAIIKDYKIALRQKEADQPKGRIGFHNKIATKEDAKGFVYHDEFEDDEDSEFETEDI